MCARMNTPIHASGARTTLRVAVVTETYPPEINGVARTVGLMVEALCGRGHDVQLVRPRQRGEAATGSGDAPRELLVSGNRTDCTLVPTAEMRSKLKDLGFERVAVVGRGVDTSLFSPARRSERLRATWGCRGSETVALYVGRLAPEKNLGVFVEAALAMRAADSNLRVVLVGDGPQSAALRAQHPDFVFAGT